LALPPTAGFALLNIFIVFVLPLSTGLPQSMHVLRRPRLCTRAADIYILFEKGTKCTLLTRFAISYPSRRIGRRCRNNDTGN
jgi:hypothetical protein